MSKKHKQKKKKKNSHHASTPEEPLQGFKIDGRTVGNLASIVVLCLGAIMFAVEAFIPGVVLAVLAVSGFGLTRKLTHA